MMFAKERKQRLLPAKRKDAEAGCCDFVAAIFLWQRTTSAGGFFQAAQSGRKEESMHIKKEVMNEIIANVNAEELSLEAQSAIAEIQAAVRRAKEDGQFLFEDLDSYRAISVWTGIEDVLNVMEDVEEVSGLDKDEYQEIAAEVTETVDWNGYAFIDQSAGNSVILEALMQVLENRGLLRD